MAPTKISVKPLLLLVCLAMLAGNPFLASAKEWQGTSLNGTIITKKLLEDILESHFTWTFINKQGGKKLVLDGATLNGVDLSSKKLIEASLLHANFTQAKCINTDFSKADLSESDFSGADLTRADFSKATLWNVNFRGANCTRTVFFKSDLYESDFSNATMMQTIMNEAKLTGVSFFNAKFECRYLPDRDYLGGIRGLSSTRATKDTLSGLIRFRQAFRDAGLRQSEREVTYAIEQILAASATWPERWFKTLLFNWTCAYGMYPGRPLWIMLGLFLAFIPIYWVALWPNDARRKHLGSTCPQGESSATSAPGYLHVAHLAAVGTVASIVFITTFLVTIGLQELTEERVTFLAVCSILLILYYILILRKAQAASKPRQVRALKRLHQRLLAHPVPPAPFSAIPYAALFGLLSAVLFFTTLFFDKGSPTKADLLAAVIVFCLIMPAYWLASIQGECQDGIFRTWSADRIRKDLGKGGPELLPWPGLNIMSLSAVGWAMYFSLLSTFNLGFREINVGTWIARIQPQEYTLKATGWVRVVSGFQSLISIYLLALWVLTYFGRPFD